MQTILTPAAPLPLSAVTLEQAVPPHAVAPTLQAFRAGSDWRDAEYTGPQYAIGDKHPGTWRVATRAGKGAPVDAAGEYLSLADGDRSLFLVDEGTDFPSQRGSYDGTRGALRAQYGYDVILLGPIEETAHIFKHNGARTDLINETDSFRKQVALVAVSEMFPGLGERRAGYPSSE